MNALDVVDPRSGVPFAERPYYHGANRSDQKEPKQTLGPVSRDHLCSQPVRTARITVSKTISQTGPETY